MCAGQVRVGIGGWVYEPWRGSFFPPDLPKSEELAYASRHVTTIEINATFYRNQNRSTFERWAATTPDDFVFAIKANRFAVNRKDLAAGPEAISWFVTSGITSLQSKLGPILWQLAPFKRFNADEISGFLSLLPRSQDGLGLRHVIEPRHKSFVSCAFIDIARQHNVAVCLALADDYPMIADATADFCYLRLQTTADGEEQGYSGETITAWTEKVQALSQGRPAPGLPLLNEPLPETPRDCFVYMIAGAKHRNPSAARAMLAALDGCQR